LDKISFAGVRVQLLGPGIVNQYPESGCVARACLFKWEIAIRHERDSTVYLIRTISKPIPWTKRRWGKISEQVHGEQLRAYRDEVFEVLFSRKDSSARKVLEGLIEAEAMNTVNSPDYVIADDKRLTELAEMAGYEPDTLRQTKAIEKLGRVSILHEIPKNTSANQEEKVFIKDPNVLPWISQEWMRLSKLNRKPEEMEAYERKMRIRRASESGLTEEWPGRPTGKVRRTAKYVVKRWDDDNYDSIEALVLPTLMDYIDIDYVNKEFVPKIEVLPEADGGSVEVAFDIGGEFSSNDIRDESGFSKIIEEIGSTLARSSAKDSQQRAHEMIVDGDYQFEPPRIDDGRIESRYSLGPDEGLIPK
jgi:hypothetical protein